MNKKLLAIMLIATMLFASSCNKNDKDNTNDQNSENGGITNNSIVLEEGEVVFKGQVLSNYSTFMEVEIIDSEIAFGKYIALISAKTEFYDKDGNAIDREDITTDNVIEIVFSGQVMNSYPPKISAKRIYLN